MSKSLINQSYLTGQIDKLVRDILSSSVTFDDIKSQLNELYLPFMESYDDCLCYSKPIQAFVSGTKGIVGDSYPCNVIWGQDNIQKLIDSISCYRQDVLDEDNAWQYQEKQNRNALESYARCLLNHYSKSLVVRVDLMYTQDHRELVTINMFNNHMKNLRELISNKKSCFKCLQGYAWALEQGGKSGGFHCHLLLIYDGARREGDCALAIEISKKWKAITEGLGTYYNCNSNKHKKKHQVKDEFGNDRLGVGMIHRNNLRQIENAVYSALYLTKLDKKDQQLKVWLPNMRTFGHGTYRTKKRRGLPPIAN
ncbi:YagK/YfjJ domain-containing protein [Psychrobacter glacincola]|uniref:YagK/YfjJ domain-containing protein n=1 Tax=Psychrobacter TaxID=497 RepID=UPI003FD06EDA